MTNRTTTDLNINLENVHAGSATVRVNDAQLGTVYYDKFRQAWYAKTITNRELPGVFFTRADAVTALVKRTFRRGF